MEKVDYLCKEMKKMAKFMVKSNQIPGYPKDADMIIREVVLPDDETSKFGDLYYPLTDETMSAFIKGMKKKRREKLLENFSKKRVTLDNLFREELLDCLSKTED